MNEQAALVRFLEGLDRAIAAPDELHRRAALAALLSLFGALKGPHPLVLSYDDGAFFIQGHDVPVEAGTAARLSQRLAAAGIVSILFHAHVAEANLLLLLGVLRGEPGGPDPLDDPEGPLGEGRGIRVFALASPVL